MTSLAQIVAALSVTYNDQGVAMWLASRRGALGSAAPIDVIARDPSGMERIADLVRAIGDADPRCFTMREREQSTATLERLLAKHQLASVLPGGVACTCGAELAALNPPLDDRQIKGEPLALAVHQLQEMSARSGSTDERRDALRTDIYAEISYYLGIDDTDDGACDAKNAATNAVLRLIERELADADALMVKVEAAWDWIARVEPLPHRNGDLLGGLRAALSGGSCHCDRCRRPLPHSEPELRVCAELGDAQ